MSNTPKHILVIRLSALGDVAMTVPVLRALTTQHPDLKITVLTRAFFAPFFRDLSSVSVYSADVTDKHKGVFGLYKLAKELKNLQIDAVADLHNVLRSKIIKQFLRIKPSTQIDKGRADKKALISGKKFQQLKSMHQRYADVFNALGYTIDLSNPSFQEPKKLQDKCREIVGEKTEKWIGIAPFATYESKMYPLKLMAKVIDNLSSDQRNKILLFGAGAKEIESLNTLQNKHNNVVNLAGKFSLEEELDIISNLDVMVSMDSGNAHMAAMLGKKVISLWGVTHPFAGFYPFNQDLSLALMAKKDQFPKIPTSVYGNKYPKAYKNAAGSILVEDVLNKIKSVL